MSDQILIVDDEKSILELTAMVLRNRGFEVLTASDGHTALELIAEHRPPLALLDYMMPGLDGLSALKQIRGNYPDTFVIMFTGKGSEKVAVELMKAGAADYILKPFSNQDLVERIETVLKLRRFEIANRELREERERLLQEIEAWNLELEKRVEVKTRELERAHSEILQSEKLAVLGHMSAGMAHEIRNPLNSISLFAQVLKGKVPETERSQHCDKILGEVTRIDDILVRLLDVSKSPVVSEETVDLLQVGRDVLSQFDDQFQRRNLQVSLECDEESYLLQALADDVQQIFTNLIANALQAVDDGGCLSLTFSRQGDNIHFQFADDGQGIPEENQQKIFDPFFTTKPRGTGFGLSVVLRVVKNCAGTIWVESRPGHGATFHLLLPASSCETL